ncbi:phage protease [Sphingomonas sp. CJ99]
MKRAIITTEQVSAAASSEVALVDGAPARRVKVLPIGTIAMRDGRGPYRIRDRAHAEQVVAQTQRWLGSADLNFDFNHQVLANGADARAAGWVPADRLIVEDDGIYADQVEWTQVAAAALTAREYRYLSPLFMARPVKDGGDVLHLKNVALVNVGAIDLPAIAAGLSEEENPMDLTAIAAALGLSADATVEQIAAAAADLKKSAASVTAIATSLGLASTASVEEVAARASTLTQDMVPASVVDGMKEQLALLNKDRLAKEVDQLVAAGILPPAKHADTLAWFEREEVVARNFFKDMPPMIAPGEQVGGKPGAKSTTLTADEVAACEMTGMSHEDFLAAKNEGIA